ncbi:hypothetical protein Dimus_027391, partial [Dionaea muscipula]
LLGVDDKELWDGIPKYGDIGIRKDDELYFVADEEANTTSDPSSLPADPDLVIGRTRSPTVVAQDLLEVEDLLTESTANAAALAA